MSGLQIAQLWRRISSYPEEQPEVSDPEGDREIVMSVRLFDIPEKGLLISIDETASPVKLNVKHTSSPSPAPAHGLGEDNVYVIDSVRSGTGRQTTNGVYVDILKPLLDYLDLSHLYLETKSRTSIAEFARKLEGKHVTVIIIGGDTSINEFINGLNPGEGLINFGVIPAGTGNSLSLALGSTSLADSIKRIFSGNRQQLQVYSTQFPEGLYLLYPDGSQLVIKKKLDFLVVTSWAFHAALVADSDTEKLRKLGIERFQIAAQQNLSRKQEYHARIRIGDNVFDGPFAYVVTTPSQRFEPQFVILPEGNIADDSFYLVAFKTEDDNNYIMDIMKKVYDGGRHIGDPRVIYEKVSAGSEVVLEIDNASDISQRRFCVDGAIAVLPERDSHEVTVSYSGYQVLGWDLFIL